MPFVVKQEFKSSEFPQGDLTVSTPAGSQLRWVLGEPWPCHRWPPWWRTASSGGPRGLKLSAWEVGTVTPGPAEGEEPARWVGRRLVPVGAVVLSHGVRHLPSLLALDCLEGFPSGGGPGAPPSLP